MIGDRFERIQEIMTLVHDRHIDVLLHVLDSADLEQTVKIET